MKKKPLFSLFNFAAFLTNAFHIKDASLKYANPNICSFWGLKSTEHTNL